MKNILVTGGAGFIGSHTILELIKSGFNPIVLDNFCNSERFIIDNLKNLTGKKDLKVYEADCTIKAEVTEVFRKESIDGVIHFAAYKAVGESFSKPLEYHANNVNSLTVLLECMKEFEVTNLVFSSSCTVYGDTEDSPVSENSIKNAPTSPYGRTKAYCEAILKDNNSSDGCNLNAVILRYFNPIGAHPSAKLGELPLGPPNNLVPYITQTAIGIRDELTIFGGDYNTPDGTCVRDYIHVVDVALAHLAALHWVHTQEKALEVFNLGSGKGDSVLHVVKTFEECTGEKLNYSVGPRRIGDVSTVYADPSKAKRILGWETKFTLGDALTHAWQWQKQLSK